MPLTKSLVTQSVPDLCTALLASSRPPPAAVHPSASCPSGASSWPLSASLCNDRAVFGDVETLLFTCLGLVVHETSTKDPCVKGLTEFNSWIQENFKECSSEQNKTKYMSLLYARGAPGDVFWNTRWFLEGIIQQVSNVLWQLTWQSHGAVTLKCRGADPCLWYQ